MHYTFINHTLRRIAMKQLLAFFFSVSLLAVVGCEEQRSALSPVSAEALGLNKPAPVLETIFEAGTLKMDDKVISPSGEIYRVFGTVDFVRGKRSDESYNFFTTASQITVYNVDNLDEKYTIKESRKQYYEEVSDPTIVIEVHTLRVDLNLVLVFNITAQTRLIGVELEKPRPYTDMSLPR
jgi:hypothetical protein